MIVAASLTEYTEAALAQPSPRPRTAYVPTMGALHDGHRSLIRHARGLADRVVVSIFVNPLQFGPDEDYARYPRPIETDLATCEAAGVDVVLRPSVAELYPAGRQVSVSAGTMGTVLEGRSRPGHFDGVLTVLLKLFNIIRPDVAVFGRKDAQQLACIDRMALDLNLPVEIVGAPTVRDPDGLALSSRNAYLTAAERLMALSIPAALERAAGQHTVPSARSAAYEVLNRAAAETSFRLDYATLVNPGTFAELSQDHVGPAQFVIAATVGGTRLIDNTPCRASRRRTVTAEPAGAMDHGSLMDLEAAADELYGISPDAFVERRIRLVAQARAAKDRELARQIGQLRRPTRTAWLVNLLARHEPDRLTELLTLGAALQDAQRRMSGEDLRRLSRQRRSLVDSLARRAVTLGEEQDYAAADGTLQQVGQSLQAALGDPEVAELVRLGRLTQAVTYGGFGPGDLAAALAASLPGPGRTGRPIWSRSPGRRPTPRPARKRPSTRTSRSARQLRRPAQRLRRPASWLRLPAPRPTEHGVKPRRPRPSRTRPPDAPTRWPMRWRHCGPGCGRPRPPSGRPAKPPGRRASATPNCGMRPTKPKSPPWRPPAAPDDASWTPRAPVRRRPLHSL